MNVVRAIWERREMLANLVSRELKGRYKGSALGFLWTILTPLFMAVIYVFFLRLLAGRGVPMEQIIIGVFAWQFTVQSITTGMGCVTGNANLVKKVYFPRLVLPLATTTANLVNFLLTLVVQFALIIVLRWGGQIMGVGALAVPLLILYHTLFNLSLALLVAASNAYFRDTQHLVGVFLSAWFFLSPVMYNLSFVERLMGEQPAILLDLFMLNPMTVIITGYRAMILPDVTFPWSPFAVAGLVWPLVLLGVSLVVYEKSQKYFPDVL
ncbi:MAG: ABC transporter permease [Kiritimatiellae bacterium]|nr:ABC transporter permease [Kiritimatiellia bacterium]